MDPLEARVRRLEVVNRRLALLWGLTVCGAFAMGAQLVTPDVLRAKRVEVVNAEGVPMVILGTSRGNLGGEVTLRDREGERRAWIVAEPGTASVGLQGGKIDDPSGTAAIRADTQGAAIGVVGARASASMAVRRDQPRVATVNAQGRETFSAPWK